MILVPVAAGASSSNATARDRRLKRRSTMRLQLLSDLHLETEVFEPEPAPGAELLVLAGDIDSSWAALERFRGWPVPVLFVAGNHEFDGRETTQAWPVLRSRCEQLSITMLECETRVLSDEQGKRIRFVATTRWCDFDLFGAALRDKAMRAASYYMRVMRATRHGAPFDAAAAREEALACRAWLKAELALPKRGWDALTSGNVTVYEAAGDHVSMLKEPHATTLATQIISNCQRKGDSNE